MEPGKGMVEHRRIPLDSSAEWKEALQGVRHSFAHTWESCYAMQLTTNYNTYLYHFEKDGTIIVCPIAERRFDDYLDIVTPYGFSGFTGNNICYPFTRHWASFVKEQGYVCGYIALSPLFESSTYFSPNEAYQSNSLYFLDLTLSIDELFANLNTNRRRQLRNWAETVDNLILDRDILTDFFLENYPEFLRRVSASAVNYFSKDTLAYLCGLDNMLMVGAGRPEEVEAVCLFAYTGHSSDYLFGVTVPEGRHHITSLLWFGINYLKSIEIPFLNLGGGIHENDSLAEFKQRFGGKRVPFRSLKQVYRPKIYEELCRRVNADPTDMAGYFPAYRSLPAHRNPLWARVEEV